MAEPGSARQSRKEFNAPRRNPNAPQEGPETRGAPGGNGAWKNKNAKRASAVSTRMSLQKGEETRLTYDMSTEARIKRQETFLTGLIEFGTIRAGCTAADVDRRTYYLWIERHPEFKEAVEHAFESFADDLEEVATIRARDKSDNLLMFLLKKLRPQYRDNYVAAPRGKVTDADQQRGAAADQVKSKLDILRERQQIGVEGLLTSGPEVEDTSDAEFEDEG